MKRNFELNRRDFIKKSLGVAFGLTLSDCSDLNIPKEYPNNKSKGEVMTNKGGSGELISDVFIIKTEDREFGIGSLLERFSIPTGRVAVKANYNSADPFPASTHLDTLSTLFDIINDKSNDVCIAERSGMGDTKGVLKSMGVIELASEKGIETIIIDEEGPGGFTVFDSKYWKNGFPFSNVFLEADSVVQTCCLKTHMYGGHFTMSLKNSVGMVARIYGGYNYMMELHSSPNQRRMIAEINKSYEPDFIVMDGIKGFSKGGPASGTLIEPGLMLASRDRVALDAVGVAILRMFGTTPEVSRGKIFEQEQISTAVELGIGAPSPENIELIPLDKESEKISSEIERILSG